MEQQPQYQEELPADGAVAIEREQLSDDMLERGADGTRVGQFAEDVAPVAEGAGELRRRQVQRDRTRQKLSKLLPCRRQILLTMGRMVKTERRLGQAP